MARVVVPLRRIDGSTEALSDEALVAACALGDRAALGALFDRHYASVRAFLAHAVTSDPADVDDLVQATFETVQRAAHRFRSQAKVRTWILGIAHNLSRHHVRARTRKQRLAVALVEQPVEPSRPIDEVVLERQRLERLERAVAALSPKLREVFVLVYVQGLADAEAAEVLGIRTGAVWKRLHDARHKIRELMGEVP